MTTEQMIKKINEEKNIVITAEEAENKTKEVLFKKKLKELENINKEINNSIENGYNFLKYQAQELTLEQHNEIITEIILFLEEKGYKVPIRKERNVNGFENNSFVISWGE